jgi:predicted phosphodiesterase/ribosome-associated translation inhibitor RaiA
MNFTEEQIAFILSQKTVSRRSFAEIASLFSAKFKKNVSAIDIKQVLERYQNNANSTEHSISTLKTIARTKKTSSHVAKESRTILQAWNDRDDILEAIKEAAKEINKIKIKTAKPSKKKGKLGITKELLLSDIHFGKKTDSFNLDVCKKRLEEVVHATIGEIERDSKDYNIDEIVVALLGDIIENYTMHVLESAKGCEFGNAKQVYEATINLFKIVIIPLNQLGIKMRVVCVTGNHDRDGMDRTYHNPGEENFTHIIYNTLKNFSDFAGLKNIEFIIPKESWAILSVYGNTILYEHYDNCKNADRKGLEALMTKRANQFGITIDYMRGGHFHEPTSFRNGRMQINGCLTGNDSFASVLGFNAEASQTLNTFVNSQNRRYKMYRSFNILLE